jgi:predicted PurR-regulated permease PerM
MPIDQRSRTLLWLGLALASFWLIGQLKSILLPFLLAGILAYVCAPMVDRLQRLRMPRLLAVTLVMLALTCAIAGVALIIFPMFAREVGTLIGRLPDIANQINERWMPWLRETFDVDFNLDATSLRTFATDNADSLQAIAKKMFDSLRAGGIAVIGLLVNLFLMPLVVFYLLSDWPKLIERIDHLIPRAWHEKTTEIARAIDDVLSQFLRGQLLVMTIMAIYYSVALSIVGSPSAIAIGLLTGLLTFIPYLGFGTGFVLALLVAALQFAGSGPVIAVLVVYGIGQILENYALVPYLVGERIGLHPLVVVFAMLAFGQLFGFFGVLLALPVSAALLVGVRELHRVYLGSRFYQGGKT